MQRGIETLAGARCSSQDAVPRTTIRTRPKPSGASWATETPDSWTTKQGRPPTSISSSGVNLADAVTTSASIVACLDFRTRTMPSRVSPALASNSRRSSSRRLTSTARATLPSTVMAASRPRTSASLAASRSTDSSSEFTGSSSVSSGHEPDAGHQRRPAAQQFRRIQCGLKVRAQGLSLIQRHIGVAPKCRLQHTPVK